MTPLAQRQSREIPKGTAPMEPGEIQTHLAGLPGWALAGDGKAIEKTFRFKNYCETMSFVNAVAHVANRQDHHPEMLVGYNTCRIQYNTHTVGGVSENDLICAARIEQLA